MKTVSPATIELIPFPIVRKGLSIVPVLVSLPVVETKMDFDCNSIAKNKPNSNSVIFFREFNVNILSFGNSRYVKR